jgi:hypothetical protein
MLDVELIVEPGLEVAAAVAQVTTDAQTWRSLGVVPPRVRV